MLTSMIFYMQSTRIEPNLCEVDKLSPELWLVLKLALKNNYLNNFDILKNCLTRRL